MDGLNLLGKAPVTTTGPSTAGWVVANPK
jgi:hypothetical protein